MSVTREDAENVLNFNLNFGVDLPDKDIVFLYRTFIGNKDGEELDQPTSDNLKRLCCQMLLSGQDVFEDGLYDDPKAASKRILAGLGEAIGEALSKGQNE